MKSYLTKWTIVVALFTASSLNGASITLTGPVDPQNLAEGNDYFTEVLHDPVDFDKRRDILWEEHFTESSIGIENGIWSGNYDGVTKGGKGAYIFPLFMGIPNSLPIGRTGINHPLDSQKYRYVSLKCRVSEHNVRRMYWTRDANWPDGSYKTTGTDGTYQTGSNGETDGYRTNNTTIYHAPDDWVIYLIDLRNKTDWTDAPVTGIRYDASPQANEGAAYSFDWFRAIDPDTSPTLTIRWNTEDVTVPNPKVNIYIDDDDNGYDGAFLTRVSASDGSFSFPAGALPPGTYYVYLKLFDNLDGDTELNTSAYSAPITINGKGTITFKNPSKTSGPEYSSDVLHDPWDMNNSEDVANLSKPSYQKCFVDENFTDGHFEATAVIDSGQANTAHTDVQVWMNIDADHPVETAKYHYATYSLRVDGSAFGNISDKVAKGWIARLIWWSDGLGTDGEQTNDIIVYEDQHSYTVDLADPNVIEPNSNLSGQAWLDNPTVSHLRLDPLETSLQNGPRFYLYDVKLTGDPIAEADGTFEARFTLNDPENEQLHVAFYLDDNNTGFDGTKVGEGTFAPGSHSLRLDLRGQSVGLHYLYAVVTDGFGNVSRHYAEAPIVVETEVPKYDSQNIPVINYLIN